MENLVIEGTAKTPTVNFNNDGILVMEGRAIPEYPAKFFSRLFDWVQAFNEEVVTFEMKLEYFNTAVSKKLLELMKLIERKTNAPKVTVNWHYEEGDEDAYESGLMYHDLLPSFKFNFLEYLEE